MRAISMYRKGDRIKGNVVFTIPTPESNVAVKGNDVFFSSFEKSKFTRIAQIYGLCW